MDLAVLDATLRRIRTAGDCQLVESPVIGAGFESIAPHRVGIAHLMLKPRFLLADPVGTGKTPQALIAFGLLREKAQSDLRCVVVASKSALFQWQGAVEKFLNGIKAEVIGYDEGQRQSSRDTRHVHWQLSDAPILITTYTSMARDIEHILPLLSNFILIFDEAQRLKGFHQRLLRPAALKLAHKARYCWGLSATPLNNRLDELHSIMEVIRPGIFGSQRHFLDTYQDRVWVRLGHTRKGFWHVRGHKNLDKLMFLMEPYYLKRPAEVINAHLPPVVFQQIHLQFNLHQRDIYDQIVQQWFPETQWEATRRLTHLASLTYAQIASDAPEVLGFEGAGSSKMDELARFLTEEVQGEKVIVYTRYEKVVTYVCTQLQRLGVETVRITGKENARDREVARVRFNGERVLGFRLPPQPTPLFTGESESASPSERIDENPNKTDFRLEAISRGLSPVDVIVVDSAGGESLDLQAASIVLFYDLPWSWGELQQVIGRARRIGNPHQKILGVLLANANSIDTYTLEILQDKEALVGETFGLDDGQTLPAPPAGSQRRLFEAVRRGKGACKEPRREGSGCPTEEADKPTPAEARHLRPTKTLSKQETLGMSTVSLPIAEDP